MDEFLITNCGSGFIGSRFKVWFRGSGSGFRYRLISGITCGKREANAAAIDTSALAAVSDAYRQPDDEWDTDLEDLDGGGDDPAAAVAGISQTT